MDGVRKDFYVGGLLRPTVPLALYYAGQRQLAGVNYTVNYDAASITVLFDKAPEAGDERRLVLLAGNFDTSLALQNIIMGIYPIGSIFIHYESTNPSGILGFGTWQRIAHGRMLVGVSEDDNDVNAAGREGGAKTVAVTTANLPAVKINIPQVAVQMNPVENHTHPLPGAAPGGNGNQGTGQALATDHRGNTAWAYGTLNSTTSLAGGHTPTGVVPQHETGVLGQGTALNKMPPYYTVYMWRRVA
jgi:hypothetical protein